MMDDFDDDPLDLLDDDGDGVIEICLFFDEDKKKGNGGGPQTGKAIKILVKNKMKFKIGMKLDEAVPQ